MASPQLENGYTKIPHDFMEHFLKFSGGGSQCRILMYIARYTFGFHKAYMRLNMSLMARTLNLNRSNCIRALRGLVEKKIIIQDNVDRINMVGINEDYGQWSKGHSVIMTHVLKEGLGGYEMTQGGVSLRPEKWVRNDTPLKKRKKVLKDRLKEIWAKGSTTPFGQPIQKRKPRTQPLNPG